MLTLDFTRSRNLSQEFTASRSRSVLVAVVIGREKKYLCCVHRCEKTVESRSIRVFLRAAGFLPAPERSDMPLASLARLVLELVGPRTAAVSQRGIVSGCGARSERRGG